jgi:hypothetical protein
MSILSSRREFAREPRCLIDAADALAISPMPHPAIPVWVSLRRADRGRVQATAGLIHEPTFV